MSNKATTDKSLNIVEKYSFRGRRKCDNSVDNDIGTDAKLCKTSDNKELSVTNTTNLGKSSTKSKKRNEELICTLGDKCDSVNKSNKGVVKKQINRKNKKTPPVTSIKESDEMDIENCDELLIKSGTGGVSDDGKVKWYPVNWEEMLKNIREMRKDQSAPVDDMGCHKTMDETAEPEVKRYQALVSLMLSSQTKDQITYAAMLRLREHGLTVDNILKTDENELAQLIKTVGFWKTKAKHIKLTTQILKDEYNGDIPDTVEKMLKLPGVGPKMANLCMTTAWGKVHGIGVDTHVHRISNRLEWVKKPTKTPEQTRVALESWLPPALWFEVNHLMVGLGQQICLPRNPKCGGCINNKICPTGRKELRSKTKKNDA